MLHAPVIVHTTPAVLSLVSRRLPRFIPHHTLQADTIPSMKQPSIRLKRSLQKLLELVTMLEKFQLSAQALNRMKKLALYLYRIYQ